jgi:uncharacterized protein (TIGR03437 family)
MFRSSSFLLCAAWICCAQSLEERALRISQDIQARHMPFGTILNPFYSSAESMQAVTYTRCGDSAIWTGHYLAAEAFRYRVTRTRDALEAARAALRGIRALIDVTGSNNLLARCVLRADSSFSAGPRNEEAHHGEYTGKIDSVDYYWIGNTSRDQYMGVFFGLSVAFELIDDAVVRTTISDLVTRLINRLLEKDWAVVMPNGEASTVFWLRPDQQLSILQVGRQVNADRFGPIYNNTSLGLLGIRLPLALEASDEHNSYFKFNLAAITLYNLVRLEPANSPRRAEYIGAYDTFRNAVDGHGNAFFNVIDRAIYGPRVQRDVETMELLAAWLLRPRRDFFVDLRGKYRACGDDRACDPIPVVERVRTDFLWQRSPFLLYGGGDGRIEAPGIDFILPYWMGRHYGMDLSLMAVSAASGASTVAPNSLVALYGAGLPPGSRVEIQDAANRTQVATVLFSNTSQINFLLPGSATVGPARVTIVDNGGSRSHSTVTQVQRVAPALFSASTNGRGPASALAVRVERDGRQTPVRVFTCAGPLICHTQDIEIDDNRPVYLSLFATGIRGRVGAAAVTVAGRSVPVLYAGPQAEFPGLDQINVQLPGWLRGLGKADVVVTVDGISSNAVEIEIE